MAQFLPCARSGMMTHFLASVTRTSEHPATIAVKRRHPRATSGNMTSGFFGVYRRKNCRSPEVCGGGSAKDGMLPGDVRECLRRRMVAECSDVGHAVRKETCHHVAEGLGGKSAP